MSRKVEYNRHREKTPFQEEDGMKKFFNKYFFIGFGVGILFTIMALVTFIFASILILSVYVKKNMEDNLSAPKFASTLPSDMKTADYNWSVKDLNGKTVPLKDYKGKVVFLNIWATWCPPCKVEMPSLQKLYDKMKNRKDVVFLTMSSEDTKTVKEFIEKNKYTFPVYILDESKIPEVFQTDSIPATFLITPEGKVAFSDTGCAKWDDVTVVDFINKLAGKTQKKEPSTQSTATTLSIATAH